MAVRRPEKETHPKLFYKGAHQVTLDPLAAQSPPGGIFMWSEQSDGGQVSSSGSPDASNSSAAAVLGLRRASPGALGLAGEPLHPDQGDRRRCLPGGGAAGAVRNDAMRRSSLWQWTAPVVAGAFLGLTGVLLIWDLEHPTRFYMIFTKSHWRSWLVRGSYIIAGYSAILGLHFLASLLGQGRLAPDAALAGHPAGRHDRRLYRLPLCPGQGPRPLAESAAAAASPGADPLAGSAAVAALRTALGAASRSSPALGAWRSASFIHLLLILGEITLTHATAHARWRPTR